MDENEFDAVSEDFKITVASIISSKPENIQGMENLQLIITFLRGCYQCSEAKTLVEKALFLIS